MLVLAVALSALLIAAVSTAMTSIQGSLTERIASTIGRSDVIVKPRGTGQFIHDVWIEQAKTWEGAEFVAGRFESPLSLRATVELYRPTGDDDLYRLVSTQTHVTSMGNGFEVGTSDQIRPISIVEGRLPTAENEIAIDTLLADRLAGRKGDSGAMGGAIALRDVLVKQKEQLDTPLLAQNEAERFNEQVQIGIGDTLEQVSPLLRRRGAILTIVGIVEPPPLGGRPQAYMTRAALAALSGAPGMVSAVELLVEEDVDVNAFVDRTTKSLSEDASSRVIIQTTAKITSGLQDNMRASRIGMVLASAIAFLSASFIIMTGLTVDIAQRQHELAVLRCIGGKRSQLAKSQIFSGLIIGGLGATIGTPLGIAACALLMHLLRDQLRSGLVLSWWPVLLAGIGAVLAGLIGALWPAWKASSTSPLRALSPRVTAVRPRSIALLGMFGLLGLGIQLACVLGPSNGNVAFFLYILIGLPAMFVGYFLLGVPAVVVASRLVGPLISRLLSLPPRMLQRTIAQTPYRFGFTAGAMMGGLALMISIWTQGGSLMRDWLNNLKFPDAFVSGIALPKEAQQRLDELPFVTGTCAITLHSIETDVFGVAGMTSYRSSFIAFEPEVFFDLAELQFIEGDAETAKARLIEGGAVMVAREFKIAKGLGVGDTFTCRDKGEEHEFEIVAVVTSPGLEIVSKFFNIGEEYTQQAIHAVFGSRDDMIDRFGVSSINLIQIDIDQGFDDAEAIETIRTEMFEYGILDAGSGRAIKSQLRYVLGGAIGASTIVGVCSMIVACFGVANLIAAGIEARRFEFGVLRGVGAQKPLLLRLVIGEALIIAAAACVLGTAMGFQGAWAGARMNAMIIGLELKTHIPTVGIGLGWLAVMAITIAAAAPAGYLLMRTSPRALLQGKG